ncbi:LOW QUALITY PROTEIN: disease resistance protein CHL1-like [Medicago truncatula]|uniref:LOW QUALITY PROTEIN: disease resistance protein CHL1-like n=1 Tax=Medicago truncatula TaxID=3880 RepID=UPI000D2F46BF|nr:LOW QUALITY PROTEIN: disease resistance protein CHL1-like [Medicago truncatula]
MFGDSFHNFVDRILMQETSHEGDKFISWVATISKATTYSGPIDLVQIPPDRNKSEYIDNLVERVTRVISNKRGWLNCLNTMSINSRVQDVIQLLKQSKSPLLIGIWGMAGIGKTTIAQAIYHQIGPYFADKCFLKKVKGAWEQESGQVFLQQKLIFDIDQGTEIKIRKIESGKQILKYRFRHKRILLVLDNVDKLEQLNALCENPEWFGVGSKIIITSRNRHLLKEHGFDHIYRVKELDGSESLELFNYGAFRQTTHPQ